MDPNSTSLPYQGAPGYGQPMSASHSQTMSVGDWLITMLISFIPLVGFIMLFVWAFSSSTPPSKANWAKATLIFFVLAMVLGIMFAGSLMAIIARSGGMN